MTESSEPQVRRPDRGGRRTAMSARDLDTLRSLAARIDPKDAGAHNNLGVVYFQKGLLDEAVAAFERALELDPRLAVARRNAQIAYAEGDRFQRRVRGLREALDADPEDVETRDALARAYLLGGDPGSAAREWRGLLDRFPDSTALHMKVAYAEAERGRDDEAVRHLEAAARLAPEATAPRIQLAELLAEDRPARAEREVREALALDDGDARAHAVLGRILERTDRPEEARAALDRARELDPNAVESEGHLSLERYASPDTHAPALPAPPTPGTAHGELGGYARAVELRRQGDLAGARESLEASLAAGAGGPELREALAEVALLQGGFEEAAEAYRALLAEREDSPKLWNERGVALHRLGRLPEAVAAYGRAVALDGEYRLARNNLGVALAQSGEERDAAAALEAAATGDPLPEVFWNLGLFHLQNGRPERAVDAYRAAVESDDRVVESWSRLGTALFESRRPQAARDALLEALARDPDHVEARYHLGFALSALGDFPGALRETQRALELAPVLPTPRYQLLIDVRFEAGTIPAPETGDGERVRSGMPIRDFEFDSAALDAAFAAFAEPGPAPEPAPSGAALQAELDAARLALRRGQLDRAAEKVAHVVARLPGAPAPRLLEGEILLEQGLAGEALERFDAVAAAPSADRPVARAAREGRARSLLALARPAEAVEAARSATTLGGERALLARALMAAGRADEAVPVYEAALAAGETQPGTVAGYGDALLAVQRLADAETAFRRALRSGGSAAARVGLARTLEAMDRVGESRSAYRRAVDSLPSYGPGVLGLADLEWRTGHPEEAVRVLVDLLTLDPVHVEALVRLGVWLAQLGRWDQARRTLERAVDLAPDRDDARRQLSALSEPGS